MQQRWSMRFNNQKSKTKYEPLDTARSIESLRDALDAMDESYVIAGLNDDDWQARRKFITRTLLKPLLRYRSSQLGQAAVAPVR